MSRTNAILCALLLLGTLAFASPFQAMWTTDQLRDHDHKSAAMQGSPSAVLAGVTEPLGAAECTGGVAAVTAEIAFSCEGVDLLAFVPVAGLGQEFYGDSSPEKLEGSDVWGWTSPTTGEEYVLMGKTNSTAFFRIVTDADTGLPTLENLGELPNPATEFSVWKDIKVRGNHAYIVAEASAHGMQVFDLTTLDGLDVDPTREHAALAHYRDASNTSHNIVINPDTDFAYIVGGTSGNTVNDVLCGRGGLHFVDISDPAVPTSAGCSALDLYVHDAQCVTYHGPDTRFTDHEICFNAAEEWVSIVDVTDKAAPVRLGLFPYTRSSYVHQGWLTEDHRFFLLGDETDEQTFGFNTRTMIFDFEDLTAPQLPVEYFGPTTAIDHNMYTRDGLLYQSNYAAGLRILDTEGLYDGGTLAEIAHFDVFPDHDNASFVGTWSNYPYFDDGVVAVNAYDGLFLLQVDADLLAAEAFVPGE
ncbi:choice-of-anchor B family protein [Euzebya rosea]|uniref:choice-of-anchor B family protein n=1 Tax=Euzebya rosea TaxID=2052804 RepID=UPI000D3EAF68|nr:choice-of-anchor B family protein [Euzebya rosea]